MRSDCFTNQGTAIVLFHILPLMSCHLSASLIQQSGQIKDKYGKGKTKRSNFCLIVGKASIKRGKARKSRKPGTKAELRQWEPQMLLW